MLNLSEASQTINNYLHLCHDLFAPFVGQCTPATV